MAHKFERCRMEPQPDGSVNIGILIVATIGQSDDPDPAFSTSAQWRRCSRAHAHGWDTCDVRALFGARTKRQTGVDAQNQPILEDVPGTSAREQLVAWLQERRAEAVLNIPKEIPLPTRTVTKQVDGKDVEVEEPIKDITLT